MHVLRMILTLLGRVSVSLLFIMSGIHKIFDWQGSERGLANAFCDWQSYMEHHETFHEIFMSALPWVPVILVFMVVVELLGGFMVLFGLRGRLGAFLLIIFLIPTTILLHQFWFLEGLKREVEFSIFLKNISILGGLFYVLCYGTKLREKEPPAPSVESPDLSDHEE